MKKFEENGFTATVTKDVVRWEIPISSLIVAFNNSPENYSEDGEHYITVKRGKRQEFAEYVAQQLMLECDSETGARRLTTYFLVCLRVMRILLIIRNTMIKNIEISIIEE